MSKTLALLLALALAWFLGWSLASMGMGKSASEQLAQAEHVSTLATRIEPGAEVRAEGTIVPGPKVPAPFSQKPCLIASTRVLLTSSYRDSQNRVVYDSTLVAHRRAGPPEITIDLGGTRAALPAELWVPSDYASERASKLPPRLNVTEAEIEAAKQNARGDIGNFRIAEATLQGGERVFVVAKLEDGAGPLRLAPDPVFGRVELFAGSQTELVNKLRTSGGCGRTAAWIVGAGVGPLPLAVIGLVLLLRRRREKSTHH